MVGSPRVVKHQLLELLSPISFHHGVNFLAAVAVAWHERRQPTVNSKRVHALFPMHLVINLKTWNTHN